jgi:uncharacterized protein YlxW (UPF0749 family)
MSFEANADSKAAKPQTREAASALCNRIVKLVVSVQQVQKQQQVLVRHLSALSTIVKGLWIFQEQLFAKRMTPE